MKSEYGLLTNGAIKINIECGEGCEGNEVRDGGSEDQHGEEQCTQVKGLAERKMGTNNPRKVNHKDAKLADER